MIRKTALQKHASGSKDNVKRLSLHRISNFIAKQSMKLRLVLILVLMAAAMRVLPHWPNFTPLAAIGLFGAAMFQSRLVSFLVPFAALFVSDLFLNNVVYAEYYDGFVWFTSIWQYLAFGLVVLLGELALSKNHNWARVGLSTLAASLLFFAVSNFGVWAQGGMYPKTMAGLGACYAAGLPFLGPTMLGDLFYSTVLFGGFFLVYNNIAAAKATA